MLANLLLQEKTRQSAVAGAKQRIQSIDIVRGAIMLIMALDHVRVFVHVHAMDDEPTNLATSVPALFFTRWITHFCAPVFLFLSGVSAFLSSSRKPKKELSLFLMKRGLWLILVELIIVTFSWSFDPTYPIFILQVIWAIGWSMIILGLLVRTSITLIVVVASLIFFGHNMLDFVSAPKYGLAGVLLNLVLTTPKIFYQGGGKTFFDVYAILPWTSIMLLGYAFGSFYGGRFNMLKRRNILLNTGVALTILFILLRWINGYGDPEPWSIQKNQFNTVLSLLNTTKYPISLQYSCMTLGPALIVLGLIEKVQNGLTNWLTIFGRVPFFFYVIHIYLIHSICVILFFATAHSWNQISDPKSPFLFRPFHFGFNLLTVYGIWLAVIVILYFPCKWYNQYKSTHHQWWLGYL